LRGVGNPAIVAGMSSKRTPSNLRLASTALLGGLLLRLARR
jgi:hypothetical protein